MPGTRTIHGIETKITAQLIECPTQIQTRTTIAS